MTNTYIPESILADSDKLDEMFEKLMDLEYAIKEMEACGEIFEVMRLEKEYLALNKEYQALTDRYLHKISC